MNLNPHNTPIIIPCFNRPEFLSECLSNLDKCSHINEFDVYLSFDIKDSSTKKEMINILSDWKHPKKHIVYRPNIWHGSLNSTGSIGYIMKKFNYKKGFIYIEDDVIVSKCFLDFCLDSLNYYEFNPHVMMVSGHTLEDFDKSIPGKAQLNKLYSCSATVGIAGWWDKWKKVHFNLARYCQDPDFVIKYLEPVREKGIICHMNSNGGMTNKSGGGLINALMLINEQVCLIPDIALCNHIGWHGWHFPLDTAHKGTNAAFSYSYHIDNTYDDNFIDVNKQDVLRTFGI